MNCLQNQRERFTTTEPPPHVAHRSLRVSRSEAQSNLHSLDNSRFSPGISNECRPLPTAGGFFSLDDDDNDYLLEDSQVSMDSTVQCLYKCGHKQLEVSYPRRSRSFLGYLPEVEEEISIPFPRDVHGSSTVPLDENFCNAHTRPESNLEFIYSNPSSLGLETSRGVSYFSNADGDFQRPRLEEEILVNSSLSSCTLGQTQHRAERRMLLSTPEKFHYINQEGSDIYNGGISFHSMSTFRNLRYEGTQSPGHEVQFHNRQGAFVTSIIRPKQAMRNSSEVPSSSSVSVSSDETEHPGEHPQLKVGLYKTELCRSWEETGFCRYGAKCQFAHGYDDLRPVPRHPKYKTELCRSFTDTGLCSYGKRCRFVHSSNTPMQTLSRSSDLEKTSSRRLSIFQQLCGAERTPYWITSTKSTAFSLIPIYMNLFQTDAGAFREPKNI